MLNHLHKEFEDKKCQCKRDEMNASHAFNMIFTDLTGPTENAKDDVASKTKLK